MGSGVSKYIPDEFKDDDDADDIPGSNAIPQDITFTFGYSNQRKKVRNALSKKGKASYAEINRQIENLRKLLKRHPEYCYTAREEIKWEAEFEPTSKEAVKRELDRLYTLYEEERYRKSSLGRITRNGCPLGHAMVDFDEGKHPEVFHAEYTGDPMKYSFQCVMCERTSNAGSTCTYCRYDLCQRCSIVYCKEGHIMVLWTDPESQHSCIVCNQQSIHAGYKCNKCWDYDFCDMCTARPGRLEVQKGMAEEIERIVDYMTPHVHESRRAKKYVEQYKKEKAEDQYPTTLMVYNKVNKYRKLKNMVTDEIILDRLTVELKRLRGIFCVDTDLCEAALREYKRPEYYTGKEVIRLKNILKSFDFAKSKYLRDRTVVACPAGHAMFPYEGIPEVYSIMDSDLPGPSEKDQYLFDQLEPEGWKMQQLVEGSLEYQARQKLIYDNPVQPEVDKEDISDAVSIKSAKSVRSVRSGKSLKSQKSMVSSRSLTKFEQQSIKSGGQLLIDEDRVSIAGSIANQSVRSGSVRSLKSGMTEKTNNSRASYASIRSCKRLDQITDIDAWKMVIKWDDLDLEFLFNGGVITDEVVGDEIPKVRPAFGYGTYGFTEPIEEESVKDNNSDITPTTINSNATQITEISAYKPEAIGKFRWGGGFSVIYCRICNHVAETGFHCEFCQYEICMSCKVIHCIMGHVMVMWTEPHGIEHTCFLCKKEHIHSGYYCKDCDQYLCDKCTRKESRESYKKILEQEVEDIMNYMHEHRRKSDVARSYHWRRQTYIVSYGVLAVYVKELREAKQRAMNQVKFKKHIDEMKQMRQLIIKDANLCALSAREAAKEQNWYYSTKKEINREKQRLSTIIDLFESAKTVESRSRCVIACPLGHGTVPMHHPDLPPRDMNEARVCRVCIGSAVGGNTCPLCDYDICIACSTVYCRMGHPSVMWTEPQAFGLSCNVCGKIDLKAGYRCSECNSDICDLCSLKDARDALKLWPKKEIAALLKSLSELKERSEIAFAVYERDQKDTQKKYLQSMSLLCNYLRELRMAKEAAERDIAQKNEEYRGKKYGLLASDL
jgi:hypothetical protein